MLTMLVANGFIVVLAVLFYRWVMSPAGRSFSTRFSHTAEVMSADTRASEPAGAGSARPTTGLTDSQSGWILDEMDRRLRLASAPARAQHAVLEILTGVLCQMPSAGCATGGAAPPAPHSEQRSDNCQSECSDPTHHTESSARTATTTYTDSNGEPRSVVVLHAGTWVKLVYERQSDAEIAYCHAVNSSPDSLDLSPT